MKFSTTRSTLTIFAVSEWLLVLPAAVFIAAAAAAVRACPNKLVDLPVDYEPYLTLRRCPLVSWLARHRDPDGLHRLIADLERK